MSAQVIKLPINRLDDLDTFEEWIVECEPWSIEKNHVMSLIDRIANDKGTDPATRVRAARMLYDYSDGRKTVEAVFSAKIDKKQVDEWLSGE